jgi:hypothetical protein
MRFQKRSAADRDDVTKAAALLTASAACRDRGHALIGFLSAKPRPGAGPGIHVLAARTSADADGRGDARP